MTNSYNILVEKSIGKRLPEDLEVERRKISKFMFEKCSTDAC
jgi:hypothetical protein